MSTTTHAPTTALYGGYSLTHLIAGRGEETNRFQTFLNKDGKKIAYVSNDGRGGSNHYERYTDAAAALGEFEAYAAEWNKGSEFAGIEDADALIDRLLSVKWLNARARSNPFLYADDPDFFETGNVRSVPKRTRDQAIAYLSQPSLLARGPRLWDKARMDFTPVA